MGMIELRVGMSKPRAMAWIIAERLGTTDGLKSFKSAKRMDQTKSRLGIDSKNPSMTDGRTNMAACVMIIAT